MTQPARVALRIAALAAATVVLFAPLAPAQTLYGSIVGTVVDSSGAAVPGATVTATNTGTNLKIDTVSGSEGGYTFRNLPPGTYDLSVNMQGFRELRQTGVPVSAGNPVRIELKLEVGALTEAVNVVSETTLLQTEKADIHTELQSKELVNLPLNQFRNYQALINLVPGATPAQTQNAEIDTPGRALTTNVNGTQRNNNAFRIDGAVSVNIWLPHHVGYVNPAETIESVNISTNNFDADQGMAAGMAVTVVTKSGTNEFHGSAYFFRNQDELNANGYYNNAFGLKRAPLSRNVYGGTLGGPIQKNKLFFFGSFERYDDTRGYQDVYTVPTAKMRAGDFSEVAAAYPDFQLYNPLTGNADGTGRTPFAGSRIPAGLISPVALKVMNAYPMPNTAQDLDSNGLADDYVIQREPTFGRNNYDAKLTWQRSTSHNVWAKFSMLRAKVSNLFMLGYDGGGLGDTKVYVGTVGHTWTLSPTVVLDGSFGINQQNQTVTGPDYGTNIGSDDWGIPGTNGDDIRQSGMPLFYNGYQIGQPNGWVPLFRKERSYTFTSALTKVFPKHEIRGGIDIVRHELNHWQPEFGEGPRGAFGFSGYETAADGYEPLQWNSFASFLLGVPDYVAKDVQAEEMTGREWQSALFIRDRWNVTKKLTLSLGARLEYYPLMKRADRGLERLDYNSYTVLIGGKGGVPEDVGIQLKKWYFAPRLGLMYRLTDNSVVRAGYGRTFNALPWSRPMRGSYPLDISYANSSDTYQWVGTLGEGIPPIEVPDISSGHIPLPEGIFMRSPNPTDVNRATIQQWNLAFEQRLPWDVSLEVAYVGSRTDGGYADLNVNYADPGTGQAGRKYYASAGTNSINDWAARTKSRYKSLQVALNRPFRNGLMLKGAYTLSQAKNETDDDGWTSVTWNYPGMYDQNFALAGFDRTHVFQLGFLYELPFLKDKKGVAAAILHGWQLNGIASAYSGTPFSISGSNGQLNAPGAGPVQINYSGDYSPSGSAGSDTEPWYDPSLFSQPTGATVAGFGNSGRNKFRRPGVWNLDLSLFRQFPIGKTMAEVRVEASNVFNHTNWGAPNTDFYSPNFMKFTPSSAYPGSDLTGPRRVQLGVRYQF